MGLFGQLNPFAIPLLLGILPIIWYAVEALRRRAGLASVLFAVFMLCIGGYMLTYSLELLATDLDSILAIVRFEYLFIHSISVAWLFAVFAFTGRERWVTPGNALLMMIVPVFQMIMAWTNHLHGLNWAETGTADWGGYIYFDRSYGATFWIGAVYGYGVLLAATALLYYDMLRSPDIYRGQVITLILGTVIGWIGHVVSITGIGITKYLDVAPFALAIALIPLAFAFLHFRLFDLIPAAYEAVLKSMADAIFVVDEQNRIVEINPVAEQLINATASETVGKTVDSVLIKNPELVDLYKHQSDGSGEIAFHGDKSGRIFDLRVSPIVNRNGRTMGRAIVLRDVTARKRAEERAIGYAADLEQRNRELDAFSYTVAHDLKAPLNMITTYSQLLLLLGEEGEKQGAPDKTEYFISQIQSGAFTMAEMIDNLLMLARVRDIKEVVQVVEMEMVARRALQRFLGDIEKKNAVITIDPDMPPAMGDPGWIEEIFANLVSNALKYAGKQNDSARISIHGKRDGKFNRYEIADNGLGISPDDQKRLFEKFSRFHTNEARGMGLGLSIVLSIVTKLKGRIGVESEPGKGSTFWFTLPARPDETTLADITPASAESKLVAS